MPIYRPTVLRQLLAELATHPKKGLSQNFLIDGNILRKIVQAAAVAPGDLIVEIGPGPGALTECLLAQGAAVLAIEMDATFAKALHSLNSGDGSLEVFCCDILKFPLSEELSRRLQGSKKAKVVANLPYHLTSPILGLLLPLNHLLSSIHVMVQEEVARRLTAFPATSDYSSLSVFTRLYGDATYSFGVGRRCFMPSPKVDSAIVSILLKPLPADISPEPFLDFVHSAFSQRRKMIRKTLSSTFERSHIEAALQIHNIPPTARAETLSCRQLLDLFLELTAC